MRVALIICLLATPLLAHADNIKAPSALIQTWNAWAKSVAQQNDVIRPLQDDYADHNPTANLYTPDIRKLQRERRINMWDAVIKEQEIQLEQMKQMRELEKQY